MIHFDGSCLNIWDMPFLRTREISQSYNLQSKLLKCLVRIWTLLQVPHLQKIGMGFERVIELLHMPNMKSPSQMWVVSETTSSHIPVSARFSACAVGHFPAFLSPRYPLICSRSFPNPLEQIWGGHGMHGG